MICSGGDEVMQDHGAGGFGISDTLGTESKRTRKRILSKNPRSSGAFVFAKPCRQLDTLDKYTSSSGDL